MQNSECGLRDNAMLFALCVRPYAGSANYPMKEEKEDELEEAKELFKEGLKNIFKSTKKITEKIIEGFREGYAEDVTKKEK